MHVTESVLRLLREERRQLARIRHIALSVVVVFGVSMPLGYRVTRSVWAPILSYAAFIAIIASCIYGACRGPLRAVSRPSSRSILRSRPPPA